MQHKGQRAGGNDQEPKIEPPPPRVPNDKMSAVRTAVQGFLVRELGARESRITKIAPIENGTQGWAAEAEILVPSLEIKTLGLKLTHDILEQAYYLIELDTDLVVRSYEYLSPSSN
jgi:hypothetical protein